jgi:hypothetical protein
LEIDFDGDAPALRNEVKVWLMSGFLDESSVADAPGWFRIFPQKKYVARDLSKEHEQVTSNEMLAVCRAGNGMVTVARLSSLRGETGYPLLCDEVVESIGSEDYDRMVAYLGQQTTDEYFRAKRSGST